MAISGLRDGVETSVFFKKSVTQGNGPIFCYLVLGAAVGDSLERNFSMAPIP